MVKKDPSGWMISPFALGFPFKSHIQLISKSGFHVQRTPKNAAFRGGWSSVHFQKDFFSMIQSSCFGLSHCFLPSLRPQDMNHQVMCLPAEFKRDHVVGLAQVDVLFYGFLLLSLS